MNNGSHEPQPGDPERPQTLASMSLQTQGGELKPGLMMSWMVLGGAPMMGEIPNGDGNEDVVQRIPGVGAGRGMERIGAGTIRVEQDPTHLGRKPRDGWVAQEGEEVLDEDFIDEAGRTVGVGILGQHLGRRIGHRLCLIDEFVEDEIGVDAFGHTQLCGALGIPG